MRKRGTYGSCQRSISLVVWAAEAEGRALVRETKARMAVVGFMIDDV